MITKSKGCVTPGLQMMFKGITKSYGLCLGYRSMFKGVRKNNGIWVMLGLQRIFLNGS